MSDGVNRREFLKRSGACGAWLATVAAAAPPGALAGVLSRSRRTIRAQEPWGRLEEVGPSVWALVSNPLDDRTTLCNGGIIAGDDEVIVVEGFASPRGAEWMGEQARRLTGRWPTRVILTHYHGDHTGGVEGFFAGGESPRVDATAHTRDRVLETDAGREEAPSAARTAYLQGIDVLVPSGTTVVDLGGRTVSVVSRHGHTGSDVTVEVDSPSVAFCGDLVWNGMFPNYMDAIPSRLSSSVRALASGQHESWVPGHGPLATADDLNRYVSVIDAVEEAARSAWDQGVSPAEAAADFVVPEALGEWMLFSPRYFEVAFTAWHRELSGE